MIPLTKQYYSIGEVSRLLGVPIYTLRFWEDNFPMFNPNRTPKGTRKFTQDDVRMAELIKGLVYDKGLKVEKAIIYINKAYRKHPPRHPFKCNTREDALALLKDARIAVEDAHVTARIDAVINFLDMLNDGTE